jgi:tripartite-type tricarboxylate transporter receptor subunit TctC
MCFALLLSAVFGGAQAAQWTPSRPVRLLVPFPPSGTVDVVARIISPAIAERLGQPVIVDNRGGANAIIGTDIVAKAPADGQTLLIVPSGHAITPTVTRKLPYDTLKDLVAVAFVGNGAYVLVINPNVPAKTVSEFVAFIKARPGKVNYASTGHGNATHLAGELFNVLTGTDMQNIVYKGGGPALTDLIGGQIAASFLGVASTAGHIKSGKLRALGVTTARRAAALPDLPTIAEAGIAGFEVDGWYGVLGPAKLPDAVIQRFNAEVSAIIAVPEVKDRLLAAGIQARAATPREFHELIVRDIARWASVVKKARIEPQ